MLLKYLRQPHPFMGNNWYLIIISSIFIACFMIIFQPFGLNNYANPNKNSILLGYGAVTFLVLTFHLVILPTLFKTLFNELNWTILKSLVWFSIILISIGIANFAYSACFIGKIENILSTLLAHQFYTFAIGIIPLAVSTIILQNTLLSRNLMTSNKINDQLNAIRIPITERANETLYLFSESRKEKISINISSLLFIESRGNYIHIHSLNDKSIKVATLRTTLKLIETESNEFPQLIRCHRGFLVNAFNVIQVSGNSQGYKLTFKDSDIQIPLARGSAKDFQEFLKNNS